MKTLAAKSPGKAGRPIDRILVAVDLAKHSETTALFAAQVAQSFDADLTVTPSDHTRSMLTRLQR
jgi:hypothetical protein